jgi:hypothetical protein
MLQNTIAKIGVSVFLHSQHCFTPIYRLCLSLLSSISSPPLPPATPAGVNPDGSVVKNPREHL